MNFQQNIKQAITNIFSAKLRSFLAVLGILVGTASVVALVSGGKLATKQALDHVKKLGVDLMAVSIDSAIMDNGESKNELFNISHIKKMVDQLDFINAASPYVNVYAPVIYQGKKIGSRIIAATETLSDTVKIPLLKGRFISFMDQYEYFCVIGYDLYQQLKEQQATEVIGSQIKINNFYFTIVGIADDWEGNSFLNSDVNASVIVPINMGKIISKYAKVRDLVIKLQANVDLDKVQFVIENYILSIAPEYKISFKNSKQIIKSMQEQSTIFTLLLGMIGGISLLVGGIGIMNIMLVSVAERKREIGIRMAVGATRKDIRTLFLIESITLTMFGGIMGIILGIVFSYVITVFFGWEFHLFFMPAVLGFGVSCLTGIFFGFYPAYSAAKLDPIQTLRYE